MKQKPAQSKNGQAKGGVQAKPAAPSSALKYGVPA